MKRMFIFPALVLAAATLTVSSQTPTTAPPAVGSASGLFPSGSKPWLTVERGAESARGGRSLVFYFELNGETHDECRLSIADCRLIGNAGAV